MTSKEEARTALFRLYGYVIAAKGDKKAYLEYSIVLDYIDPSEEKEGEK